MNQIEIRYSYFSQKAKLNMNGEKASPYSEVAVTLNNNFLEAAVYIISGLDNEVFDDYEIELYATNFQHRILLSMAQRSDYCKAIHFNEIESMLPKELLFQRFADISNENNISVDKKTLVKIYCEESNISIPKINSFSCTDIPNADIGIFKSSDTIPPTIGIPLLLSDSFGIQKKSGRICYCIPEKELDLFWEYYELDFIIIPAITKCMKALRYAKLSNIQRVEINAISDNKPAYYIGDIPSSMDQGDSVYIEFASFPAQFYMLESENPNIVMYQGNSIIANNSGITNLVISNKNGEIVASKTVNVVSHQYAEEIRLLPHFDYLKRSERGKIDLIIVPSNAEDANKLVWEVSDTNVIQIDESGNIVALEEGKASIRVSGHSISTTLVVEVKPVLQELCFFKQYVRLKNGETIILDCNVIPSDACAENFIWELDNKAIASINPSKNGRRCQLIASKNYEGKGNIRCYDPDTKIGAICNIEVISKVKQGIAGKLALWCWIIGIIMPCLLPVSIVASIYGLACDQELEHCARYIVCIIGSIMTLLFWIMVWI